MNYVNQALYGFCFGFGLIMVSLVMKLLFKIGFCG